MQTPNTFLYPSIIVCHLCQSNCKSAILFIIFLVLTLATGGLALWVRHSIASGIETIADPFAGIATRAPQQKVAAGQEPAVNILVLGTDSRTSTSDPSQWKGAVHL